MKERRNSTLPSKLSIAAVLFFSYCIFLPRTSHTAKFDFAEAFGVPLSEMVARMQEG